LRVVAVVDEGRRRRMEARRRTGLRKFMVMMGLWS
jgi:hypothetical protein